MDYAYLALAVIAAAAVGSAARGWWDRNHTPDAVRAALLDKAASAIKQLNAMRTPATTPAQVAQQAHEAAVIAQIKADAATVS